MKNYASLFFPAILIAFVVIMAGFGGDGLKTSTGAPPGYTNSPGDGQNCSHCGGMGGSATAVTGWITSDVPATGYVPGNTYTITATAPGTGKKGFEISPQDLVGNLIGTLVAGTGNKLVGTNKYVTHSSSVTTNPAIWNFHWTAPLAYVGDVIFYGSFAVTKTATKTTTMTISESTLGVTDKSGFEWSCYPNPAHDRMFVKFVSKQAGMVNVDILSLSGNPIRNLITADFPAGERRFEVMLNQPAGLYLLRMTGENGTQVRKIIVE